jgi:hypothetical protein
VLYCVSQPGLHSAASLTASPNSTMHLTQLSTPHLHVLLTPPPLHPLTCTCRQCKPIATLYSQCGGNGGACKSGTLCGDKSWAACPEGSTCLRQSPFYWQCVGDSEVDKYKNSFSVQSFDAADASKPKGQAASSNKKPQPQPAANSKQNPAPVKVIAGPGATVMPAKPAVPAAAQQKPAAATAPTSKAAMPVLPGAVAPPQVTRAAPRPLWPWSRTNTNKP